MAHKKEHHEKHHKEEKHKKEHHKDGKKPMMAHKAKAGRSK